jgi:hypothetical protein
MTGCDKCNGSGWISLFWHEPDRPAVVVGTDRCECNPALGYALQEGDCMGTCYDKNNTHTNGTTTCKECGLVVWKGNKA